MTIKSRLEFPKGFRWGVATAAHQVEGNNVHNDWWVWEKVPGRVKGNEHSGAACDHWNRIEEDTALIKKLNLTDYRFSIEWARIEPRQNEYDQEAIEHYAGEVKELLRQGITPMITLHHFTFPQWVREKGGFEWEGVSEAFGRVAEIAYKQIGPGLKEWCTINEPMVHIMGGYFLGVVPPSEKRSLKKIMSVMTGALRCHVVAYHKLHELAKAAGKPMLAGMAHHLRTFDPYHAWNPIEKMLAAKISQGWNWSIPDAMETGIFKFEMPFMVNFEAKIEGLKNSQDYLGVNYYSGDLIRLSATKGIVQVPRQELPKTDLKWDIYPEGFLRVLREVGQRYPRKKVFITENGIADATDSQRAVFIVEHLKVIRQAITEGVPIEGFYYWSLMDNYEWIEGFEPRFGLYEVDYKTQKRTARASAIMYSKIAAANAIEPASGGLATPAP